jgi:hypothetical protein
MKKNKKIILVALFTFFTVFLWIGAEVYLSLTEPKVPKNLQKLIKPLNPNFDEDTLNSLKERRLLTESELIKVDQLVKADFFTSPETEESETEPAADNENNIMQNQPENENTEENNQNVEQENNPEAPSEENIMETETKESFGTEVTPPETPEQENIEEENPQTEGETVPNEQ